MDQAARRPRRNVSAASLRLFACSPSIFTAVSMSRDALPVAATAVSSSPMSAVTCRDEFYELSMLDAMSRVTASCSSTAEAIAMVISEIFEMSPTMASVDLTASEVAV